LELKIGIIWRGQSDESTWLEEKIEGLEGVSVYGTLGIKQRPAINWLIVWLISNHTLVGPPAVWSTVWIEVGEVIASEVGEQI
jgi:hypothetical protein